MTDDEMRTRVMLVDDHPMWLEALGADLRAAGFEIVATAGSGEECMRRVAAVHPEVIVMDLQIPEPSGVLCTEAIMREFPDTKILVMSASGERDDVLAAVKVGAKGYVLKSSAKADLLDAVQRTACGEAVFTPALAALVLGEYRRMASGGGAAASSAPTLTDRETDVLRLVAKGLGYREIADRLFVSHRTVQNHVQNVLRKLELHNRVELTRYAIERGLDEV
ncbi:MAG: response regulator transcription factor [Propionibacteriaceae bacterium]|jgi:DNA-binding NarL/FixJ family response regulator|nr:response regulator transcription factor [Propionibacteriaceae bacterium]